MSREDRDLPTAAGEAVPEGYLQRRVWALVSQLRGKGILSQEDMQEALEGLDSESSALGARVVARAWTDSGFKARLLSDASAALEEFGVETGVVRFAALENTEDVHHLVVCTLCSCYPRAILGRPPTWYKSLEYRSRGVADPRGVLREFGLELSPDVEVRVYDSTADLRYFVIPQRPAGTRGMSEEELAALVTRDSMIGTGRPREPGGRRAGPAGTLQP
ncbi:MAG: nitrile hydratase subunit alpha [Thermoplasmata archaeon]